jgi:YD repeat-containing protein
VVTADASGAVSLWDATTGELKRTSKAHEKDITSVAISSDGKRFVTASMDGMARLWELPGGEMVAVLPHQAWVIDSAVSPNSLLVATGSKDGTVSIWTTARGEKLRTFSVGDPVYSVTFSPDNSLLAVGTAGGVLALWRVSDGALRFRAKAHSDQLARVSFSPDGKLLTTAGHDGFAEVWDVQRGVELARLGPHENLGVEFAVFSPDGTQIATTGWDGVIRIWSVSGRLSRTIRGHRSYVNSLVWNRVGLLSASTDGSARVYDPETGMLLATFQGHSSGVYSARFAKDRQHVVTTSFDGTARIWRYRSHPLVASLVPGGEQANSVLFCGDGRLLVAMESGVARLLDTWDGHALASVQGKGPVTTATCRADGELFATGERGGDLALWDAQGRVTNRARLQDQAITAVSFDAAGNRVAAGDATGAVTLWQLNPWRQIASFFPAVALEHNPVRRIQFSSEGLLVLFRAQPLDVFAPDPVTNTGVVTVWNPERPTSPVARISGHELLITDALVIADHVLATSSQDRTVKLWDLRDGHLLDQLRHSQQVVSLAVGENGKLAVAVADSRVVIWNWREAKEAGSVKIEGAIPWTLAFVGGDQLLLAAGSDGRVVVIDLFSLQPIAAFGPHSKDVFKVIVSPSGGRCASLDAVGKVMLWSLDRLTAEPDRVQEYLSCVLPMRMAGSKPVANEPRPLRECKPLGR